MTVFTAIMGDYDDLKEPLKVTPGWNYLCFTDQDITSDVWRVIKVKADNERTEAKRVKICPHLFFDDDSIYIDGSFIINCDLNNFYEKRKGSFSTSNHPYRNCAYKEIEACIQTRKDNKERLLKHRDRLLSQGVKEREGMAASGVIMRSGREWIEFCENWMREYEEGCVRDQVSWASANHFFPICKRFDFDYRKSKELLFVPHKTQPERRVQYLKRYEAQGYFKLHN